MRGISRKLLLEVKLRQWLTIVAAAIVPLAVLAEEPSLSIVSHDRRVVLSAAQLLARRDLRTIVVPDSEYKEAFTRFKAVPIVRLFDGFTIPDDAVVQFRCSDGFAAYLEKKRLFSQDPNASIAYLAIEDPKNPWPPIPGKKISAGPFYLVWKNSTASAVGPEEWPYAVVAFEILPELAALFPDILPDVTADTHVRNGFEVFKSNCFTCHKMNGQGAGNVGPDLNRPMNPVAYFAPAALKQLIRDPASVRDWPHRLMPSFSPAVLPDQDLADLIAYLEHMSSRKKASLQ